MPLQWHNQFWPNLKEGAGSESDDRSVTLNCEPVWPSGKASWLNGQRRFDCPLRRSCLFKALWFVDGYLAQRQQTVRFPGNQAHRQPSSLGIWLTGSLIPWEFGPHTASSLVPWEFGLQAEGNLVP